MEQQLTRFGNFKRIKDVQDKEFLRSERGLTEDDVDFLIVEVERLREALAFYANENNHDNSKQYCESCTDSPIDFDHGQIAKSALEETK